jgi:hypothetical protein
MQKMEHKMTFFGTTVNKVARVHHLQKMEVRLKDHWSFSITFHAKCILNDVF